jgi:hypothetical protein
MVHLIKARLAQLVKSLFGSMINNQMLKRGHTNSTSNSLLEMLALHCVYECLDMSDTHQCLNMDRHGKIESIYAQTQIMLRT